MTTPPTATRRGAARHVILAVATAALLAACSSTDPDAASTGSTSPTTPASTSSAVPTATVGPSTIAPSQTSAPTEAAGAHLPSGPDGRYEVGDTYSDGEIVFTYEGLAAVPLDPLGAYTDGSCFIVLGTVEVPPDSPRAADGMGTEFRASFSPIFDGTVDEEQDDEFFNCDVAPVQDLGYTQSTTTAVAPNESATVWLDAIWESPERAGTMEAFRLYGSDDSVFTTEVTVDLTE